LQVATPLPYNFLLLDKFTAREGLSELFHYELDLLHEETTAEHEPTIVNVQQVLGQPMLVSVVLRDGTVRFFHGIVNQFYQGNRDDRFTYYRAVLVPQVWLLTQRAQSRIFQQQSVPDILRTVFYDFDVSYELQGDFHPREYCVQYRETDFNFASRLMEEEGIYYFFQHSEKMGHTMKVANTPQSHRDCPSKAKVFYMLQMADEEGFVSTIDTWSTRYQLQTGKFTLWDHNFQLPHRKLDAEALSKFNAGSNSNLEVYDFPGGYANRYDDIDKSGGAQPNELQKIFADNKRTAAIRIKELDARYKTIDGSSNCNSLTAGYLFELTGHPNNAANAKYVLTSVHHRVEQSPDYVSDRLSEHPYQNTFTCIPHGSGAAAYVPARVSSKPTIVGSQTAVVVGPAGEEIFVDKYGRVKVQFHWDRASRADASSSCWVRVAQNQAGKRWGSAYWPRIGQEVIVEFLEGDPDKPIIVGSVYNANEMPPYTLPDEKTKTVLFKSMSSKGGGGFNEFRVEDKKGSEQIFINAERNMDVRLKNDRFETIGRESHLIVQTDQLEKIKGEKHLQVTGDQNEKIGGTLSVNVTQDIQEKAGIKYALQAGTEIHLKSGMNLVLETGTSLTLKVGGNFININPVGINIVGAMVFINSGGAAGAGAGSNPEAPKDPKEADTAEPGMMSQPPPALPPQGPFSYSPAALIMKSAAASGAPFCDI